MQVQTILDEVDAESPRDRKPPAGPRASSNKLIDSSWVNIASGIILAGGAYPVVFAAIWALIAVVTLFWVKLTGYGSLPTLQETLNIIGGAVIFVSAGGLVGMAWAGLVSLITLPFMYLVAWSLRLHTNVAAWGAFWGGLVGFLAVLPFMLGFRDDPVSWSNDYLAWTFALAIGPGVTTVMGQFGGAWGGKRAESLDTLYEEAVAAATVAGPELAGRSDTDENFPTSTHATATFRFTIRHLLWVAVWLSLLLSLIRLSGVPFAFVLPFLGGWLVYQALTLWVGGRIVGRLGPWWRGRRQSRSTWNNR